MTHHGVQLRRFDEVPLAACERNEPERIVRLVSIPARRSDGRGRLGHGFGGHDAPRERQELAIQLGDRNLDAQVRDAADEPAGGKQDEGASGHASFLPHDATRSDGHGDGDKSYEVTTGGGSSQGG